MLYICLKHYYTVYVCLFALSSLCLCVVSCSLLTRPPTLQMRVHCHMQRMGGINDMALTRGAQSHTVSVGQDKKLVVWCNRSNEPVLQLFIDEERDEGLAVAM